MENTLSQIAVLVPVFNNQAGLDRSLESVYAEGGVDVVIVDDGSSPAVVIPQKFAGRTVLIRLDENHGIVEALNTGLKYILGKGYGFVARLDAGDICVAGRLEKQFKYLKENPRCMLLGSCVEYVDEKGKTAFFFTPPSGHPEIRRAMKVNNCFCHSSVMLRADALRDCGLYSGDYPAAEDYELFFRFVNRHMAANLPDVLVKAEIASNGITMKNRKRQLVSRIKIQAENFDPLMPESYWGILKSFSLYLLPIFFTNRLKGLLWKRRKKTD